VHAEHPATQQLAALDKEALIDRHLRLVADHRRMVQRNVDERVQARAEEKRRVLEPFLQVLDDTERGLSAPCEDESNVWRQGMVALKKRLEHALAENGVTRMEVGDEFFDPARHEGVGTEEGTGLSDGAIVRVVRAGYVLGDDVLRPARVVVAKS
jgi:molecular chaperone GrpE